MAGSKNMEENEFSDKLQEYTDRNHFWTSQAILQLGYSINLLTTIGIAFLSYMITSKEKFPSISFSCSSEFSWFLTLYIIGMLLTIMSIGYGFKAVISRMLDFRITRHLALTRKRFLTRNKKEVLEENRSAGLIDSKIIDISNERTWPVLWKNMRGETEFINEDDFRESRVKEKFENLRKEAKILGNLTWKSHRCQIYLLFFGIVAYGLTVLK